MPYTPPDLHDHDTDDALSAANVKAWLSTVATYADGLLIPEDWHVIGDAGEIDFAQFDNGTDPAVPALVSDSDSPIAFFKDPLGMVHLKGWGYSITFASVPAGHPAGDQLLFTLPVGYRPAEPIFPLISSADFVDGVWIEIKVSGEARFIGDFDDPDGTYAYGEDYDFNFHGVSFRAA